MRTAILVLLLSLSASGIARAADAKSLESRAKSRYSMDQYLAARNFLRVSLTGENFCKIDQARLAQMPQLLEALIQDQKGKLEKAQWAVTEGKSRIQECLSRCRCEDYVELAGEEIPPGLLPEQKMRYQARLVEAKKRIPLVTDARRAACAKNNLWLCESDLFKYLLSETATDEASAADEMPRER